MRCTWCGGDHRADQHYALGRRLRWWEEEYPFREPAEMTTPLTITLTDREIEIAHKRATEAVERAIALNHTMYFTPVGGESRYDVNYRGFGAELAARRATGLKLHWKNPPPITSRRNRPHDLGLRTEVRNARNPKSGRLVAHKEEPTKRIFLLVTGVVPVFQVRGWLEGVDLMVPEMWVEPPEVPYPGFMAEIGDLNPLPLPADA